MSSDSVRFSSSSASAAVSSSQVPSNSVFSDSRLMRVAVTMSDAMRIS